MDRPEACEASNTGSIPVGDTLGERMGLIYLSVKARNHVKQVIAPLSF